MTDQSGEIELRGPAGYHKVSERDVSGYIVWISHDHHKVHEGKYFIVDRIDTDVDIASPKIWAFTTPNNDTRMHIFFKGVVSNAGTFELFESGSLTANGSTLIPINLDRNSTRESEMLFYEDSTVGSLGTFIMGVYLGAASPLPTPIGGSDERDSEMILKKNTTYIVRFSPDNDNTVVNISFKWYEEDYPET